MSVRPDSGTQSDVESPGPYGKLEEVPHPALGRPGRKSSREPTHLRVPCMMPHKNLHSKGSHVPGDAGDRDSHTLSCPPPTHLECPSACLIRAGSREEQGACGYQGGSLTPRGTRGRGWMFGVMCYPILGSGCLPYRGGKMEIFAYTKAQCQERAHRGEDQIWELQRPLCVWYYSRSILLLSP